MLRMFDALIELVLFRILFQPSFPANVEGSTWLYNTVSKDGWPCGMSQRTAVEPP